MILLTPQLHLIDTEVYNAWIAGIGLENGEFHIMEMTNAGYTKEHPRRMYSSETDFGEIVDIRFKKWRRLAIINAFKR